MRNQKLFSSICFINGIRPANRITTNCRYIIILAPSLFSAFVIFLNGKRKYNSKEAAEDYSIILEALYPKHYNPSGRANIAKIFDLIGLMPV